jgi:hypothetical protein
MNKLVITTITLTVTVLFGLHGYENYRYNKKQQLKKLSFGSDIVLSNSLTPETTPHSKQFLLQHKVPVDAIKKSDFGLIFCNNIFVPTPLEKIHLFMTNLPYDTNTEIYLYFNTRRIGNFLTYDAISTDPTIIADHKFDIRKKNTYSPVFGACIFAFITCLMVYQ